IADAPDGLQRIVSKSLSKNKAERYQSAEDMLTDLKELKHRLEIQSELGSAAAESYSSSDGELVSPRTLTSFSSIIDEIKRHRSGAAYILVGLAVVAAILIAIFRYSGPGKRAAAFQNITITQVTRNAVSRDAAISPDGKYVAYVVEEPAQQ